MAKNKKSIPHPKAVERGREHLTPGEMKSLIAAAGKIGRHGPRDSLMLSIGFRHGLRVSELVKLKRGQIDLDRGRMIIKRLKRGDDCTHPMDGDEVRKLRALFRVHPNSVFVFTSERGDAIDRTTVYKMMERAGQRAGFPFAVHPHMLRHSCGFALANKRTDTRRIQEYLGQKNIQSTVRYTALAENRFENIWED
jgi:type 1 fimbriae regulatory protein FimB/type 1 fimbriae regulatory protein FimE